MFWMCTSISVDCRVRINDVADDWNNANLEDDRQADAVEISRIWDIGVRIERERSRFEHSAM